MNKIHNDELEQKKAEEQKQMAGYSATGVQQNVPAGSGEDKSVLEWQKCIDYTDVVSYYRGLMDIRKAFSPLADSQMQ